MIRIGLIREGKVPADNRVALTPAQCKWILKNAADVQITVQSCTHRCFSDKEYELAGIAVQENLGHCDILLGIKEVPVQMLLPGKTYLFFSHTRKKQHWNRGLFHAMMRQKITLIDYECLEHEDGQRIIGFGFFAGVVGAHNGMMAWGHRAGTYDLVRVHRQKSFRELIHTYFGLRIPPIKIAVTGSGRVAHGILEVMNLMGIHEVEPDEYLARQFSYPVYTQLKGPDLYQPRDASLYNRSHFHAHPETYTSRFLPYAYETDILMNGIYWDQQMPRLFEASEVSNPTFRIQTIADITDDAFGSVPINLGDQTIEDPLYGVDKATRQKTAPYLPGSIDVMAVGNLPNELPRDASRYFGEQLIKYILEDLLRGNGSRVIEHATMLKGGTLTAHFDYLSDYAAQ
ncbi:NAD(P)-dependent oxidoreductase [Paraflavitalea sp. CAU 1676]|uniref:NAD(P)-dependent oxidoreductase n=1 Tax=Paraflavitalea sp. CAU 1676 TaxID=3032598 RepID=UPI0023D989D0|nr:NAD(P)-dependent oxidoreductase [Paraflavitalea sp. CAU 1676]MDF2188744.1 NAD(P)-dependent oxidoreductase [Paraflavitalea sp. CAU 1676]